MVNLLRNIIQDQSASVRQGSILKTLDINKTTSLISDVGSKGLMDRTYEMKNHLLVCERYIKQLKSMESVLRETKWN